MHLSAIMPVMWLIKVLFCENLLHVCVALFQQSVVPTAKANSNDVNRLLEQVSKN